MSEWIYRVQGSDGRGPYKPGLSHKWADEGHNAPTYMEEFGSGIIEKFEPQEAGGCGFRTLEQARSWFSRSERRRLARLGYSLVKLQADRIIAESEKQLLFARVQPFQVNALVIPWAVP